jgi:hypothetical protein
MGKKIIAKLTKKIAKEKENDRSEKNQQTYKGHHDQDHHDDWKWNDH